MLNNLSLKSQFTLLFNNKACWQKVWRLCYHSSFLFIILGYNIAFGIYVRGQHLESVRDRYFVTVDAYRYVRQTRQIVESGNLPRLDTMRRFPDGMDNTRTPILFPYLLAYAYRVLHGLFPNLTFHQTMIYYPVVMFAVFCVCFFFFVRELFGFWEAVFTVTLLPAMPTIGSILSIGYTDTDALILVIFTFSLYCYYVAWHSDPLLQRTMYSILSGLAIGLLGLAWSGSGICSLVILIFTLFTIWKNGLRRAHYVVVFSWSVPIFLCLFGLLPTYYTSHLSQGHVLIAIGAPILTVVFVISVRLVKPVLYRWSVTPKLSLGLISSLIVASIIVVLVVAMLDSPSPLIPLVVESFLNPFGNSLIIRSIDELAAPKIGFWLTGYGVFLLFGLAGLLEVIRRSLRDWQNLIRMVFFSLLGLGLLMGLQTIHLFPTSNVVSRDIAISLWGGLFVSYWIVFFTRIYPKQRNDPSFSHDATHRDNMLFGWFFVAFPLAMYAIRFHLFLAPLLAMLAGERLARLFYKCSYSGNKRWPFLLLFLSIVSFELLVCGTDILTFTSQLFGLSDLSNITPAAQILISLAIVAVLLGVVLQNLLYSELTRRLYNSIFHWTALFVVLAFGLAGVTPIGIAQQIWISSKIEKPYPDSPTRTAIEWMKENLPSDAVIAARWDIGSPINELGRRATLVDDEQDIPRIQTMSAQVFCGTEQQALNFFRKYGVTHVLMTSQDIRLQRISAGTAVERFPQQDFSFAIPLRGARDVSYQEMVFIEPNRTQIRNRDPNQIEIFPSENAYWIRSISVPYATGRSAPAQQPPQATIINGNSQRTGTIKELIIANEQWYFPGAQIDATLWVQGENIVKADDSSMLRVPYAIYLTPEARTTFPVKLFLGEHSNHFELVYDSKTLTPQVKIWAVQNAYSRSKINEVSRGQ